MKRKKKKPSSRYKRMNRDSRLQSAQTWLNQYEGQEKNIAKNYRKRYGVSWECAFKELEMLGVKHDPDYVNAILRNVRNQAEAKKRKKKKSPEIENLTVELFGQDDNFAFIAGFTSGGVPYGITWEEWNETEEGFEH